MSSASVVSVNVGTARRIETSGEPYTTGIFKEPVSGRRSVAGVNIAGDEQADRKNHGGEYRAAYAYADEDYTWWSDEISRSLAPGTFGENLTLHGIDVSNALVGERWAIGTATFRVTAPRVPCYKLAAKMDDPTFVKRFGAALRPGAYLAIERPGDIGAGDPVTVIERPTHGLSVARFARIFLFERERAAEVLAVDGVPPFWRAWADGQIDAVR